MSKRIILLIGSLSLAAGLVFAETEIDTDFMQSIEDTTKSLDSDVAQKDAKGALAEAKEIEESFKKVEAYYVKKGDAVDAVEFAQKTGGIASEIEKSVAANDFDAAANSVNSLVRSCKVCHQVYKKQ